MPTDVTPSPQHIERRASSRPQPTGNQPAPVLLTQREFDELLEYSCSLPTGTTIGKRWKRDCHAYPALDRLRRPIPPTGHRWWMGEYVEIHEPGQVGIRWTPIHILTLPGGDRVT